MEGEKNYGGWVNPGERAEVKAPEQKEMERGAEQIEKPIVNLGGESVEEMMQKMEVLDDQGRVKEDVPN